MSITGWKAELSYDILVVYNVGVLYDGGIRVTNLKLPYLNCHCLHSEII